jgi:murein tripeptide amidase MpaA
LTEIYNWFDEIAAANPDVVSLTTIGTSYEGRALRVVKISYKTGNRGIFIESNIHAREWITSATATWIINELLTSNDPAIRDIAENYDWYIIPVINPDGFQYTKDVVGFTVT